MGRNGFVECRAHNAFGLRPQNMASVPAKGQFQLLAWGWHFRLAEGAVTQIVVLLFPALSENL